MMVEIWELHYIAEEASRIFARHGLACCLTGGVACHLYGTTRTPNDVDLVVLTTKYTQEQLKQMLVDAKPQSFYLIASRDPRATYKVLWHQMSNESSTSRRYSMSRCKVDLLQPGIMNIPDIPTQYIKTIKELPVMPQPLLLFMKLQAWTDHRDSPKDYMRPKQVDDLRDIRQLLDILRQRGEGVCNVMGWLPKEFLDATLSRVTQHAVRVSGALAQWEAVNHH